MKFPTQLLVCVALATCPFAHADLVSRYTFAGSNGNDILGTNHLTTTGTVTFQSAGFAGLTSASVTNNPDGNSTALSYFSTTALTGFTSVANFSTSFWVKENASMVNRFNNIFDASGAAGASSQLALMTRATAGTAALSLNNETILTATNTAWTNGTWHHVAIVGGASSATYYYDGALVGSGAISPAGALAELFLFRGGNYGSGNVRGWNGELADVQLYNHNLTAGDVSFLAANAGTAIPEPSTYGLLGAGALAAVTMARRRRTAKV